MDELLVELIDFLKEKYPAEHKRLISGDYDILSPTIVNEFCEWKCKKERK